MWFKQIQLFQLPQTANYTVDQMVALLEPLAFQPCLPSFPSSLGWVSPMEEEGASLVRSINGYLMICLQIEEKILPGTVIRQELKEKVKQIEKNEDRRVYSKEKLSLKDQITLNLLPRAFTKMTRLYAYIDTKNHQLILNTTNAGKTEQFISLFKKSLNTDVRPYDLHKLSPIMTHWIKNQSYPDTLSVEKAGVLQDPNQQNRVIRCQQQDLFANSIQTFIKEGCEVKQLALCWQDRLKFVLSNDFSVRSIQYQEELITQAHEMSESKEQQFDANFFIMTETLSGLLNDLLKLFRKENISDAEKAVLA